MNREQIARLLYQTHETFGVDYDSIKPWLKNVYLAYADTVINKVLNNESSNSSRP